ncbi:MAG: hypothetical protein JW969_10905 [Spirochaetales bacterium]|nr:hypothetical protein [Spirochaetales bacterium]
MDVEYLSDSRARSTHPILSATRHFYGKDTEPCIISDFEYQQWYHGTGVSPKDHPGNELLRVLKSHLPGSRCGYCESDDVLVIALQGCVHPMSGDAYYDYEIVCKQCGKFTSYSYAEND